MNFYDYQRLGEDRSARLHREAAVEAVVRAAGSPTTAQAAARVLRRLAEKIDHQQQRAGRMRGDLAPSIVTLALTDA